MNYITALRNAKQKTANPVIPDIKCFSPKEGDLMAGRAPITIAQTLIKVGAPAISVVTEEKEFKGSKEMLRQISSLGIPVLRKDFLTTKEDIRETKMLGASAVLLMYSCLNDDTLRKLYDEAKTVGLDVLVETHTREEFQKAISLNAQLIGINNRSIAELERDDGTVALTEELANLKPNGRILVSESAIRSPWDVRKAIRAGADAALVGTALLKAQDIEAFYKKMCRPVRVKLCGIMNEADVEICSKADILGFVVNYPKDIPWNISPETAKKLLTGIPAECESCIVTGGSPERVISLARELMPEYIQLHYKESLEDTRRITAELSKLGIRVIRSIPGSRQKCKEQFGIGDLDKLSAAFARMGVAELLVDSRIAENVENSNENTPIEAFRVLQDCSPIPVMLAGGITPRNLCEVLRESGTDRIDIMTGIEKAPGIKSRQAVRELFEEIGG